MKILQITPFFSPVHGGSAEVTYQLSKELAKRGHEVAVYTSNYKLSSEYISPIPKIEVHSFKTWLGMASFYITPGMISTIRQEIKHIDVIHMHNYRTFQNIVAHYYARKYGISYVLQAHGSATTFFQKGVLKRIFDRVRGYVILRDAVKVIAETPTEAEQYKSIDISEDKIEIVPNGIDLAEFENLPQRGKFRKKYGLNDSQKVVLYLARIHRIKGPDLLAKAFAELSKDLGGAKLVIAGPDDGYLAALKELIRELKIEEGVMFTGPLYGKDKLEAYIDADVYVLPSVYETFPVSVVEACACGTPVIVTDRCGIANIVDGQVGFAIPYDKDQLTDAILRMLTDDRLRREFGEKGKLLVREKFNWEKIAEQVENIYSSCVLSNHRAQD